MSRLPEQLSRGFASIPRRERLLLAGAMALALALVVAYVLESRPNSLAGDQQEYNDMGVFFTQGHWWWSNFPFGEAHASAYRPPVYPLWMGFWYEILGTNTTRILLVQALLAPLAVALSWAMARRLFGSTAAIVTAFVVAVFPFVWMWFGLLYTEALAIPLVTLTLLLFLERTPTTRLAVVLGLLMGIGLLIRPTSLFVFAAIAASFIVMAGWRRGATLTLVTVGVAALVIVPWTIRNAIVADGFVPLSVQDTAIAGTFNDTAANDDENPYAWRPSTPELEEILEGPVLTDAEYRSEALDLGLDYIWDNPTSVAEAFYWNGITRFWDLRSPSKALDEVEYEGRSETLTKIGLGMHYVLLPLALVGLWRHRRRRALVIPVLVLALAASVVFTTASGTRYRAPLQPLLVTFAVAAFVPPRAEGEAGQAPAPPGEPAAA